MLKNLAIVRQLEAVAFRAWPAASVHYDGSWMIRQTAGHPSKRINSVNPLDPSDHRDIETRIEAAQRRFKSYNRPLVFRQSPLSSPKLENYFDSRGWVRFDESKMLLAHICDINLDDGIDLLPVKDIGWYVNASMQTHGRDGSYMAGLTEIVSKIKPNTGYFVIEDDEGNALSSLLCVQDQEFAGILDIATHTSHQCKGYAQQIIKSALIWAKYNGAKKVWLQVEKKNKSALALYSKFGFEEIYHYSYRQQPEHEQSP